MPGILGIIRNEPWGREADPILNKMAEPIRYTSKQGICKYVTEHYAAAVVDYGKDYEFLKPAMAQRDKVLVLMDGEVYPDTADVPHELCDQSPTIQRADYCLYQYLKYGEGFISGLNGTFGLAILDGRDGTIRLAADRFGHNLMFYWEKDRTCAFASSLRSLLLYRDDIGREYDLQALAELTVFERVLENRTLFSDIKRLPAGSMVTWTGQEWKLNSYFIARPQKIPPGLTSWKEASAELVDSLKRSINKRLADQAKVGLFLSGGLDSRLVLGCCPPSITALTFSHPGSVSREAAIAAIVAKRANVPLVLLEREANYYARIASLSVEVNEGLSSFAGCHSLGIHKKIVDEGIRVVLTGDRSDVLFKDYFAGIIDTVDLCPWTGSLVQRRRAARKVMSSPIVRRAVHQDLMMLALSDPMKMEWAKVSERVLQDLQEMFSGDFSLESTLGVMALSDWQGFTGMSFVRGLATEFMERSPLFDNDVWSLSLCLPPAWRAGARIIRRAIRLASYPLALIPDVTTGVPPVLSPPLDRYYLVWRQNIRDLGRKCSRFSKAIATLRQPPAGAAIFKWDSSHDRDAALKLCPAYRNLVMDSIDHLPSRYFDQEIIRELLDTDLKSDLPQYSKLFEIIITFANFDKRWGKDAPRK